MQIQTGYNRAAVSSDLKPSSQGELDTEINKTGSQEFESMLTQKQSTQGVTEKSSKTEKLIQNIEELKEQLDLQLTMDGLLEYKEAVRSFLQHYTQNDLKMEQKMMRDRHGYTQKLSAISSIDQKINSLTENMLETNQGHLETLKQIGEINGLIVNLYM